MIEFIAVVLLFAIIAGILMAVIEGRNAIARVAKPTWEQEQRKQAITRAKRKHSMTRVQTKLPTRLP